MRMLPSYCALRLKRSLWRSRIDFSVRLSNAPFFTEWLGHWSSNSALALLCVCLVARLRVSQKIPEWLFMIFLEMTVPSSGERQVTRRGKSATRYLIGEWIRRTGVIQYQVVFPPWACTEKIQHRGTRNTGNSFYHSSCISVNAYDSVGSGYIVEFGPCRGCRLL